MQNFKNSFRGLGDSPGESDKIINSITIVWDNLAEGMGEELADPSNFGNEESVRSKAKRPFLKKNHLKFPFEWLFSFFILTWDILYRRYKRILAFSYK